MTVSPDLIRAGLVKRGMAPHHADGFVENFGDESGFNPGINEIAPMVPGSRGGFGLAQWTGPRRVALERFAAQRGVPASDLDTQLDWLMVELQGPEANAARSIFAAPDAKSAAVAVARDFLRPAPENLARRVAKYQGGAAPRDRQEPAGRDPRRLAWAYANGKMTPEDAALYEQGMNAGELPKAKRREDRAEQPDPLAAYEQIAMQRRAPQPVIPLDFGAAVPGLPTLQRYRGL